MIKDLQVATDCLVPEVFTQEALNQLKKNKYYKFHFDGNDYCLFLKWGETIQSSTFEHHQTILLHCSFVSSQILGGSVCKTHIQIMDGKWVVVKHASQTSEMGEIDGYGRHLGEAVWICSSEVSQSDLFPRMEYTLNENGLTMVSEFVPGNTLGEVMWNKQPATEKTVMLLSHLFKQLRSKIYIHPVSYTGENYIKKIRRRWEHLSVSAASKIWADLLTKSLTVNEKKLPSLTELLEMVELSASYIPLNELSKPVMCHGDLIPEDILVDSQLNEFILIDPNPQNTDPISDWSKMLMSIILYYDLAIRDRLTLECVEDDNTIRINYDFKNDSAVYLQSMDELAMELLKHDADFLEQAQQVDFRVTKQSLLINAGLMSLSIVPFHILQHGNMKRALYFYARASEILNNVL